MILEIVSRWIYFYRKSRRGTSRQNKVIILHNNEISHIFYKMRVSSYRLSCWTNPCIYKKKKKEKKKQNKLTLSVIRQNPCISTQNTDRRARMHCFLLFSVGTLPLLSMSRPYGKKVVQNIITKTCFYLYLPMLNRAFSCVNTQKLTDSSYWK